MLLTKIRRSSAISFSSYSRSPARKAGCPHRTARDPAARRPSARAWLRSRARVRRPTSSTSAYGLRSPVKKQNYKKRSDLATLQREVPTADTGSLNLNKTNERSKANGISRTFWGTPGTRTRPGASSGQAGGGLRRLHVPSCRGRCWQWGQFETIPARTAGASES